MQHGWSGHATGVWSEQESGVVRASNRGGQGKQQEWSGQATRVFRVFKMGGQNM